LVTVRNTCKSPT